jgi:hypothetical protein
MPDERRDVIITKDDSGSPLATIIGALIIAAALIVGIWYFATQTDQGDADPTRITVEIDPGGE